MKRVSLLLVLALAITLMAAGGTIGVAAQSDSDVLVWSLVGGDISTLNVALVTDGNSITVNGAMFAGLSRANPDTGAPEPDLATWVISDDGLVYTFTLKDAKWSDGTPITAKDVKFTYDAIMSDKVQSPRKSDLALIKSVEAKDDKTVVVTLTGPNCTVWGNAFSILDPLPSHKFAEDFSDFMTNAWNTAPDVVSGPYMLDERKAGEFVRLKANPEYFGNKAKIPSLLFRIVADVATVNQSLQTGTIDYAFMYPDQLEQLQEQEKFNTFLYPNNNTPIVVMNWQDSENPQAAVVDGKPVELKPNKFFGDKRVRQAVAMGYDKAALALTLGENSGSVQLSGPVTPAFSGQYDMSDITPWKYDPEQAAKLLDEAGWVVGADGIREKDGVKFEVKLVYSKLVDLWGNAALVMQDQLKEIGIKVDVSEMEWSSYLSTVLLPFKYDITVVGFGGGTEVDGIAYNLLHSKNVVPNQAFNIASYVNPKVDELLDKARTVPTCSAIERAPMYKEIQKIALEDVAYDWLVSTTQVHVLNKRITGYIGQWNWYWEDFGIAQ